MIKILMVATTHFELDGITNSLMNYYRHMDKSDMQIDFVTPNKVVKRLKKELTRGGSKIYVLPMRNTRPFRYAALLSRIIRAGKYDIVHAHGNSCTLQTEMFAAKIGGAKIRIAHSRNTSCDHKFIHLLLRPFFNRTYTHGFACGKEAGKWLFGNKTFTVIPNGNDIDKFSYNEIIRQEYRSKYHLDGKKVIGHVGSFSRQKNHEFLLDVFYELLKIDPNQVLVLMGDGELRSEIEFKIKTLGMEENVILTGKTLEVSNLLQAMDIMVFPSRHEGLPNVVVEWQLAGLPSLVSDKVTQEVKVTDLVTFMPLEEGPYAWASKINEMILSDRNKMREEIKDQMKAAGFDIEENARELKQIYQTLIEEKKINHEKNEIKQMKEKKINKKNRKKKEKKQYKEKKQNKEIQQINKGLPNKVIFVSNLVGNGGAGRVLSLVANYFSRKSMNVIIYSFQDNHATYELEDSIDQIVMKPKTKIPGLRKWMRIVMLRKELKQHPDGVVISFEYFVNMQTLLATRFLNNKVIISERNDPKQLDKRKHMKIAREILYRFADVLVCQTEDAKRYFPKKIQEKTVIIPNPIYAKLPNQYKGKKRKEIVTFCRLEPQKNLKMLINAFYLLGREYSDYVLSIYGDGSEKESLVQYVKEIRMSEKINFYEFTFDIHNRIRDCMMYVSSSNYEGLSNAMLEAMGMGLPCVVTDCPCGGAKTYIKSYENGILVSVGDTVSLYEAMKYIIEHPVEAEKMAESAMKIKEKLTEENICRKWMEVLQLSEK
jgi:glycosyltransferase involved in cell wall biosynthesis